MQDAPKPQRTEHATLSSIIDDSHPQRAHSATLIALYSAEALLHGVCTGGRVGAPSLRAPPRESAHATLAPHSGMRGRPTTHLLLGRGVARRHGISVRTASCTRLLLGAH